MIGSYFSPHVLAVGARASGCLTCEYFRGQWHGGHIVCERFERERVIGDAGVSDGDTVTVKDGGKRTVLRLADIRRPGEDAALLQVSRRNLEALCRNAKAVEIDPVDTDRYGRTVAHVRCDGVHVNWRQVEDGRAWCYPRYLKHPAVCLPREKAAREAKKGLWREANPQAPWDFRAAKRGHEAPANQSYLAAAVASVTHFLVKLVFAAPASFFSAA